MLLLYLLKWLKNKRTDWKIDVLTLEKGPLDQELKEASHNFNYYYERYISKSQYYIKRLLHNNFNFENHYKEKFYNKYKEQKYDVIYANTVVSLPMAILLKNNFTTVPKLICNVHELPTVIDTTVQNFKEIAQEVDLFIAGSELVADTLVKDYHIPSDKIKVVYDFTDLTLLPPYKDKNADSTFVIGAMGAMNWRKGNDLFLLSAIHLKKKYPELNIKFEWMGTQPFFEKEIIKNDIRKAGLTSDYIQYNNSSVDYREFFTKMNILLLTSREDPFPLVAIEAGAYGLPLITFDKATGINEIITKNKGGGFIVPYLDIEAIVEKIVFYYHNRDQIKKDSDINRESFKEFTIENSGPVIIDILENI
ncbi:hypothetical protein GCM10023210_23280 [Chryseobacterium ginsengisoli]|uniref:Glycosyl transferase family 1 domain-containing protein n=2 Tax=Chryseobacterium ginsengisoli TaxID=363853 RepID=A0ABP9ME05_9FLAO